jgi:propanediol utilization protein
MPRCVRVEISARHVHLSAAHVARLFGRGHVLRSLKDISQPGQFATRETVTVIGPKGRLENVRIIGPAREASQVELTVTEARRLGIRPVFRLSHEHKGTPGCVLVGPRGRVRLTRGVIVALRHLHVAPDEARRLKLKHHQRISIAVKGPRAVRFDGVIVEARPGVDRESFMLDTDEANAAGLTGGERGVIV